MYLNAQHDNASRLKTLTASEQCKKYFYTCNVCHDTKIKAIRATNTLCVSKFYF